MQQREAAGEGAGDEQAVQTGRAGGVRSRVVNTIPDEIVHDAALNEAIAGALPAHYNFEVHKTVWRAREANATSVALQLPEGLQMFACPLSDIISRFADVECVVLGDVTYGACCVDDLTARALGADFLVHYGHSCLIPIDKCSLPVLYVFVDIAIDSEHLVASLKHSFKADQRLLIVGTVQFIASVHKVRDTLAAHFQEVTIPQSRPLSKGEVLGCTAPTIQAGSVDSVVYVGDGRFHLEAIMIANPDLPYFRYDPYSKVLSAEGYAHEQLHANRKAAIAAAANAATFGVVLGTLGRQGNPHVVDRIRGLLQARGRRYVVVLLSEITPEKLRTFEGIDAWVQVACPRLSIDWGHFFDKPLLSPYEVEVALKETEWREVYPMDYYSQAGGPWSNYPRNSAAKEIERAENAAAVKA
mmetsp:Transcript_42960/g.102143  ORF Transcript_42960/g.102143 Transcript_42960/m.102143 type:complete len:414 (+) Transcript_42960:1-1242(+)